MVHSFRELSFQPFHFINKRTEAQRVVATNAVILESVAAGRAPSPPSPKTLGAACSRLTHQMGCTAPSHKHKKPSFSRWEDLKVTP